ncbi:MAG: DUF4349 domain-containing protein [Oscillospiraceae bacterium]|jgi:hypothetical protein|nr:DUF4349 domain-containing protein [Oscillospiraceae bacterium]
MTCEKYREQLHDFLDGKLPLRAVRAMTEHELSCPMCYALREEMQEILYSLHNLDTELDMPQELSVSWRQRLRTERYRARRRRLPIRVWAAMVSVILILIGGTSLVRMGLIEGGAPKKGVIEFGPTVQLPDSPGNTIAGLKIIQNAKFEAESGDFEDDVQSILGLAKSAGGWTSKQIISGEERADSASLLRVAEVTVRVPQNQLDYFAAKLGDFTTVKRSETTSEERSEEYNRTAALLEGYEATLERLQQRMAEAASLDEVLMIETEITSVQAMITVTAGKLSEWDMYEAFAQIDIRLTESAAQQAAAASIGARMAAQFRMSVSAVKTYFTDMMIFLVTAAPWLLILGLMAGAALLIERVHWRSRQM